jgi:cation diffusion facilitator CzcD-associated flavoprotein CzcO
MTNTTDVAIIGAGPYGLSLAAHLAARGIDHRIFGRPMDTWRAHMPHNMFLKSEGFASNLSAPASDSTLKAWCQTNGVAYADRALPIPLADFNRYGESFQKRFVPGLEHDHIAGLDRREEGFELTLESGEIVRARQVVLAVGVTWFAHLPRAFAALGSERVSHTHDHRTVEQFHNRTVAVLGGGASAVNIAHLLFQSGIEVRLIVREPALSFNTPPKQDGESLLFQLQNPPSPIGRGWSSYFSAQAPLLFYRLPPALKQRAIASHSHPSSGWYMRSDVEGRIPAALGRTVAKAEAAGDRVALTLLSPSGREERFDCDHVIAGTGYHVDMARIPFLAPGLLSRISCAGGSPILSDCFETTVPGLHTVGLTAMDSFGPLMRFMAGTEFASRRLTEHFARSVPALSRAA